ncbi:hypothetical protein PR048_008902 [Dryococelus australis]|uniref:Crossover junction endonuclease MUS81 n=1 Tax=Dryococelus australis TaxID=614101 RepID=A0ABQ9I086_9NEOP|nr:hypothetical protein PR048_008902 [Dryococelus australis]
MPDNVAGRRVFSGISHFLRSCILVLLPFLPHFNLIGSQDLNTVCRRLQAASLHHTHRHTVANMLRTQAQQVRTHALRAASIRLLAVVTSAPSTVPPATQRSARPHNVQAQQIGRSFSMRWHRATSSSRAKYPQSREVRQRISVKYDTCPNPLFEMWLQEWKDSAEKKGSDMQYCFGKALNSLRKFPLMLKSGKECGILQNFGNRLCIMLDRKLAEYKKEHPELGLNPVSSSCKSSAQLSPHHKARVRSAVQSNGQHKKQRIIDYVPTYRSGPYALLLTLLNKSKELDYKGYMTKSELQVEAQHLCETSFRTPPPDSRYTAWFSMSALVQKGLVVRRSSPAKFSLSEKGRELAEKLGSLGAEINSVDYSSTTSETSSQDSCIPIDVPMQESCVPTDAPTSSLTSNIGEPSKPLQLCYRITAPPAKKPVPTVQQNVRVDTCDAVFEPGSFDIVLLVDTQETAGGANKNENDATVLELTNHQARFDVRHLKVGDFTWVCRHRTTNQELVLPYIVERKRMDDLGKSIKDGRFHEQKFRLKQCGIENVIYLVESHGMDQHTGLPLATLQQAVVNTQVVDGFTVKRTASHQESMSYLATLTRLFHNSFHMKTLASCHKQDLVLSSITDDFASLLTFTEFSKLSGKIKNYCVKEMFLKHLLQLRGLSVEKALAIVERYESPYTLLLAYKEDGGDKLLAGIQHGTSSRLVGPVISQAVYHLYTDSHLK